MPFHPAGSDKRVPSDANLRRGSTLLVKVSVPTGEANFYQISIQGFSKITTPFASMLRTSSSTDSSTSATQIVVEYDGVDDGSGRSGDSDRKFVVSSHIVLTFRCSSDFYRRSIQEFSKIASPLTSMLWTSSSTDSSTRAAPIVVEHDGVDDGGGGVGKSSSKVEKPQRPEKSAKSIGSEEPSFLTFDTRLASTKMGSRHTKLTTVSSWPLLEAFKNWGPYQLQARSSRPHRLYFRGFRDTKSSSSRQVC